MHEDEITNRVIGAAIAVHRALGPGLFESTYAACLSRELAERGLRFEQQKRIPVIYRGVEIDRGYKVDLLVEERVIVELKCVRRFEPVHKAQLITYLRLSGCHVGLLINFKVPVLKDGIRRIVNEFPEPQGNPGTLDPARTPLH